LDVEQELWFGYEMSPNKLKYRMLGSQLEALFLEVLEILGSET
jgi:hypothetical protein